MESKYKKLIKNTAILSIGEFANKILNFLIIPLYTYVLTTEEYGQIDLVTTSISLLIPVMTLQIQEALIRFVLGKEIDQKTAISNCWLIYLVGSVFVVMLFPVYWILYRSTMLAVIFTILVLTTGFNSIFIHCLRVAGKMYEYAAKGVLGTIINLTFNVLFVLILRMGLHGYLYAMMISQFAGICYLLFVGKLWGCLTIRHADKQVITQMLRYSVPLIPNTLMWWVMSGGDKYVINFFLGDGANGLYSLALKIPTILSLFYSFFYQSWQMAAIEENNNSGRNQFYENIYKTTNALLIVMVSGITLFIRPFYEVVMSERFAPAWMYVPVLSLGMAFSCQASFFGVVYTTTKKTGKVFTTTALGALTNLLVNLLLVKPLGLQGVAIGTCLGYVTVTLIRACDTRKEIKLDFDLKRLGLSLAVIALQIMVTLHSDALVNWCGFVALIAQMVIYHREVQGILHLLGKKLLRK